MRNLAKYRKTLAAAGLGVVELAAYVAADPRNLPSWVVTGALAVNALAVWGIRNAQPVRREDLARKVDLFERPRPPRRDDRPGTIP